MPRKKPGPKPRPKPAGYDLIRNRGGHAQLVGYARVSTKDQNIDSQIDALTKAGCALIFVERVSGAAAFRPGYAALLDTVKKDDVVVVAALDRLGRRLSELIRVIELLNKTGIHIRDLRSGVNTRSPQGKTYMHIMCVLAESERELIRERTREGIASAVRRGRVLGRPPVLTPEKIELVSHLRAKEYTLREIAEAVHMGEGSVRKALEMRKERDPRQLRLHGT